MSQLVCYVLAAHIDTFTHAILIFKGRRRRNRNKKKPLGEENRGPVIEDPALSAIELRCLKQAERRLMRDEVYSLKKVQVLISQAFLHI